MDTIERRSGRREGTEHGGLRAAVLCAVQDEDPSNPVTDLAVAAQEGISESAVSQARRSLFLPPARVRANAYVRGMQVGYGLAYCNACEGTLYSVPAGLGSTNCPRGHGRITLSSYRLVVRG